MKTFNAWWIANFDTIINIILIGIFELFVFQSNNLPNDVPQTNIAIGGLLLVPLARGFFGGMPAKSITADIVNLVVMTVAYGIVFLYLHAVGEMKYFIWQSSGLCIALVIAITVAVFTYRNMDEVVSLRMLYRNSNADLFGITWQYTFNRFIAVFSGVSYLFLVLMVCHYNMA